MSELEDELNILIDDYAFIRRQHRIWSSLFAEDKRRVELINLVSGEFFYFVQRAQLADMVAGISRLCGNQKTGKGKGTKLNLVLESLLNERHGNWKGNGEYKCLLEEARVKSEPVEKYRHEMVAHRDFNVATGVVAPQALKRREIDEAISTIKIVLDFANSMIRDSTFLYDFGGGTKDELTFLDTLRVGHEFKERDMKIAVEKYESNKEWAHDSLVETPDWLKKQKP